MSKSYTNEELIEICDNVSASIAVMGSCDDVADSISIGSCDDVASSSMPAFTGTIATSTATLAPSSVEYSKIVTQPDNRFLYPSGTSAATGTYHTIINYPNTVTYTYKQTPQEAPEINPAFFTKKNAPRHLVERTSMIYPSMPLIALKEKGIWSKRLEKMSKFLPDGVWIAGGFLRAIIAGEDETNGDIDFFFNSHNSFEQMLNMIKHPNIEQRQAFGFYKLPGDDINISLTPFIDCESEVMFRPNLQLIRMVWHDSPEHVIDCFDFTVCQFITDGKTLWYHQNAFDDIKTKQLREHRKNGDPLSIFSRILKYIDKGYKVDNDYFIAAKTAAMIKLKRPARGSKADLVFGRVGKASPSYDFAKSHKRVYDYLSAELEAAKEETPVKKLGGKRANKADIDF